jgi:DNA cross-link repair 1A protein
VLSLNRQSTKKAPSTKIRGKPNASILNFFTKVDSPVKDDSIFLSQRPSQVDRVPERQLAPSAELSDEGGDLYRVGECGESPRFNETGGAVKRRKTSNRSEQSDVEANTSGAMEANVPESLGQPGHACTPPPEAFTKSKAKKPRRTGPFLSDSDTDDDLDDQDAQTRAVEMEKRELNIMVSNLPDNMNDLVETKPVGEGQTEENRPVVPAFESVLPTDHVVWKRRKRVPIGEAQTKWEALQPKTPSTEDEREDANVRDSAIDKIGKSGKAKAMPTLKQEETSVDEWDKFEDIEEFPDDNEFAGGEEFIERKWAEEQARLEAAEAEAEGGRDDGLFNGFDDGSLVNEPTNEVMTAACPICSVSLNGISHDQATRHVNGCLDGNHIPLPEPVNTDPSEPKLMPSGASNRFARKAAIARPGQANPFDMGSNSAAPSSAFSKIMSGHAEDTAWASAAAAELAARGKPAYQRTCPFYKIMPGFFICVDAFRYGAVQGCNAYFLSHFHSDHYVGLTSSWCHGPIYCSKVTANLVKQQLRVDPKLVVALDFEARFEVPGTQGVAVTMIPANHCPGSSLFLFEKGIGRGANPKIQRVLHCGDFRACPAHIAHPLLMPDIVDSITGKTKQQKIDVCYLDTTYLNPRYSFPSQEEVIKACADMCVSLKKERAEESDAWETMKRERAGTGMAKFINNASVIKPEDDSISMEIGSKKPRGRLLVVCGTYSIGKERMCMGIARALDCKIWAPPGKRRICAALEDEELMSRMTDNPREAQIHMQLLMEIRPETLQEYLNGFKPHFSRIVAFCPSGWNYRPPNSRYGFPILMSNF